VNTSPTEDFILEARGITKRYPGLTALDSVHYCVHRNAVNVLIGENGAGKSTLMRILAGAEKPDAGEILLDGSSIILRSPRDAAANGIAIVHQELSILPNLDIAENIFAGREVTRGTLAPIIDRPQEDDRSHTALTRLSQPMSARTPSASLSLGLRQLIEIARTLAHGSKILILDEPTSALSLAETECLFRVLADLKLSGMTIIYISHRLHELLYLGDHFTVLRSGRIVGEGPRVLVDRRWIVERMSGHSDTPREDITNRCDSPTVLSISHLSVQSPRHEEASTTLDDISFTLCRGEILGIYGLLGSGRTELLETIAGARQPSSGHLTLNDRPLTLRSVADAVETGIVMVPEDRQRDGLILDLSIRENIALSSLNGFFIDRRKQTRQVTELATQLSIAATDLEQPITSLSGGNQQKALLARCLMHTPHVLLLDEPTRGVDVGAKEDIYRILRRLAVDGLSIIFTSSEIEETRTLADRVLILCRGRISAELSRDQISDEVLFAAASPQVSAAAVYTGAEATL
jgi:erythritol transport system ATP-binding protein